MLYTKKPTQFKPKFEIVACYCIYKNKILYLHRQPHKTHPNRWGPPAGKKLNNENLIQAVLRELKEETQIVAHPSNIDYHNVYFVKYPKFQYPYHIFKYKLAALPKIIINSQEHNNYLWLTPQQALKLPLIQDEDTSIKLTFGL